MERVNYPCSVAATRLWSDGETSVERRKCRFRFRDLLVKMWLRNALTRLIFPVPVTLKRFFAPESVFIFGMITPFVSYLSLLS